MIVPMNKDYAVRIAGWTYENEYSVYSFSQNEETLRELMNGEYYAYADREDNLSGYFCFGKSAQIPTVQEDIYTPGFLDMGLGMNPVLCGKGYGYTFVESGLDFAKSNFDVRQVRLTVAEFNIRAIHLYKKIGFRYSSNITHKKTKKAFLVMIYKY